MPPKSAKSKTRASSRGASKPSGGGSGSASSADPPHSSSASSVGGSSVVAAAPPSESAPAISPSAPGLPSAAPAAPTAVAPPSWAFVLVALRTVLPLLLLFLVLGSFGYVTYLAGCAALDILIPILQQYQGVAAPLYLVITAAAVGCATRPASRKWIAATAWAWLQHQFRLLTVLMDALLCRDVNTTDSQGWTPLMRAIHDDDATLVRVLLQLGADPDACTPRSFPDHPGTPPLQYALLTGHLEMAWLLLECGANANSCSEPSQRTALMAVASRTGSYPIVQRLIKYGADVNARDVRGRTALMIYFVERDPVLDTTSAPPTVHELLHYGADADIQDDQGKTALIYAAQNENPGVLLLLKHGADPFLKDASGKAAVDYAFQSDRPVIVGIFGSFMEILEEMVAESM